MTDTTTPFVETELLLAVMRYDLREARRLARTMLPGERFTLGRHLDMARHVVDTTDGPPR